MEQYIIVEKAVGETPLSCAEAYRAQHPELNGIPIAYAGRLDPMASGKLLLLFGDECKKQEQYHDFDKEYEFSVLFGISSDTHDVLGRLTLCPENNILNTQCSPTVWQQQLQSICDTLLGIITLPYPHFSARTVHGKPLHMWTLENRLHEITIPTKKSTVYELIVTHAGLKTRETIAHEARAKIDTIPPVTDPKKALGNDFRRSDVRRDWERIKNDTTLPSEYLIAQFRCVASSGTYMRSLASVIAKRIGTTGLAWHIHRTKIGSFNARTRTWDTEF